MGRLPGFDYRRPFFYMVTLKKLPGLAEFCRVVSTDTPPPNGRYLEATSVSNAFVETIRGFAGKWRGLAPIECFAIMHIRENGMRAWRRKQNRRFFTMHWKISFQGREWYAYGNEELLSLPVLEPFRCSRSWTENGPEWREALGRAERIGPGGAGVGTFMSPCEKACGNAIFQAGGAFVVLAPEGFGPRWHPTRAKEALCAEGRMLFLSLWEPSAARPDNATLYRRCHEMGDLIGRMVPPSQNSGRMGPPLQNSGRMGPLLQDSGRMGSAVQNSQEEREKERGI